MKKILRWVFAFGFLYFLAWNLTRNQPGSDLYETLGNLFVTIGIWRYADNEMWDKKKT